MNLIKMSPKRWVLLLIFYISYLMFGASIYYHIEHGLERQRRADQKAERQLINAFLLEQLADQNTTEQNVVLEKITDYCGKPVTDSSTDEYEKPYIWTFYHAFFFAFTVCSTVGYGNISPTTTTGRMIMIPYSVIGIPINAILFAGLGEYFAKLFRAIYRRYKIYKLSTNVHYVPPQLGLFTIVTIALLPGITFFLLLPAWIFTYFEKWDYPLALYYSYVTTTTIGFGDYVATFQPTQPREFGGLFVVYQIFVIVWFIFSLGYLLMIMTFITRGLQSKKLARLEQQLSTNLKATQNRIWNGVTKDVGYMRRLLNELYVLKVKPVYTEPDDSHLLYRSASCPELSMYRVEPAPIPSRKRAFSECYDVAIGDGESQPAVIMHSSSDTELDKFDRVKSFETAEAYRQTTDLLAKVVNALATVKPPPPTDEDTTLGTMSLYGGYHGFSDSQILASEWSFSSANEPTLQPQPRRVRACSDFNIEPRWQIHRPMIPHNEWTWSGDNNQIQEAINNRYKQRDQHATGTPSDYVVNMMDADDTADQLKKLPPQQRVKKFSMPDGLRRIFPFKKRPSQDIGVERKFSIVSVPEAAHHAQGALDYYSTVTANASPSYFRNGKPISTSTGGIYPSNMSLASRPSNPALNGGIVNAGFDSGESTINGQAASGTTYLRKSAVASKKRRESIYAQNPALAARRGSMFPTATAGAAASTSALTTTAAQSQRRGSLFATGEARRGSVAANRRGSLFPPASGARRASIFSVTSEKDMDVLEQTTLADLIRALEAVHTHAALDEQANMKSDKKSRKLGKSDMESPELPSLLGLFGDNTKALQAAAVNRLYARRSTIVGTLPTSGILTQRRPPSGISPLVEAPPRYSEKPTKSSSAIMSAAAATTTINPMSGATSSQNKFRRRFSIRPTALQIPPGKAPPPGVNISSLLQQPIAGSATASGGAQTTNSSSSQTSLQRRLSLRPSPLARISIAQSSPSIAATTAATSTAATSDASAALTASSTAAESAQSSKPTARLLPLPAGVIASPTGRLSGATSSSTHSPLSRIVQISQAQRKISMPDDFNAAARKNNDK